jgi:hypothetical protein
MFTAQVKEWTNLPGSNKDTDNPIYYIKPVIHPTTGWAAVIPGTGYYFNKHDDWTYNLHPEWKAISGQWYVRCMLDSREAQGKKPLRKWNIAVNGEKSPMGNEDFWRGAVALP